MANQACPACGWRIHHSHTRGFKEKLIRAITAYKMYRCRECGWRGWLGKPALVTAQHRVRTVITVLVALLLTLLLALYLAEQTSHPSSSQTVFPF